MAKTINIHYLAQMLLFCLFCLPEQTEQMVIQFEDTAIMSKQIQRLQQPQQPQHDTAATDQQRIHHKSYDKNDDVVVVVADDWLLPMGQSAWSSVNDDIVTTAVEEVEVEATKPRTRKRRELSDWLIAPNTRWCGRGNTANNTYNHLGGASTADKCCRKHDHCQVYIPAMSNRYELFNYRPYTLSHCHCDRRFRTCLKMANDEDAKTIGKLFFNMVQTQCFVLKQQKVCQQRAANGSCEQEFVKQKAYLKTNKRF